jgi:peptidoglycan/LPS O-acetylase OafA/YrhL
MTQYRKKSNEFFTHFKNILKMSVPTLLMYISAGGVLMMLTLKDNHAWDKTKLTWTLVCGLVAIGYNILVSLMHGGDGYDMLVTGNVQRRSFEIVEGGYKMSKYRPEKEYRAWKGFAIGGIIALFPLIFGLIAGNMLGTNSPTADNNAGWGVAIFFIISIFVSGWSLMPFYLMNANGLAVSYYWSCLFGVLPILVSGALYIIGAYARRNKALREQRIADAQAEAQANKVKKINYGALPGTKPRKRK